MEKTETNTRQTERETMSEDERLNEYFDRLIEELKKTNVYIHPFKGKL